MKEIFVIGGGAGGVKVCQELRTLGFEGKIYLIEDRFLGGECTNVGCIPSKTVYNFSKLNYKIKKLLNQNFEIDPEKVISYTKRVVNTIRKGIEFTLKNFNIEVINKRASIRNGKIVIEDKEYSFDAVVLATGSSPIKIHNHEKVLTNRELWESKFDVFIKDLQKGCKVLIVGGGYIGLETASIFKNLYNDSEFTVIERENSIIFNADKDIQTEIHKILTKSNIKILTSTMLENISPKENSLVVTIKNEEKTYQDEYDYIITAIGRKINNPIENLENLKVNEYLQVEKFNNVWAIGDVTGGKMLAHKSEFQAKIAAKNIISYLANEKQKERYTLTHEIFMPSIMFTIPEAAWYGFTEQELQKKKIDYSIKKTSLASNSRAIVDNSREGFVKIILNQEGEILGTHIVAENSSELINIPMAYNSEIVIYPHPTILEVFNEIL